MAKHGENIYKRKDGRYEGRYVTGKRRREGLVLVTFMDASTLRCATDCCKRKRNCWGGKGANVSRAVGRWING